MRFFYFSMFFLVLLNADSQQVVTQNEQWIQDWLTAHNEWRREVGAPPLQWNEELSQSSEKWALRLSKKYGHLEHSKGEYGENIYWKYNRRYYPNF